MAFAREQAATVEKEGVFRPIQMGATATALQERLAQPQ
jgi:hypothetical protein